MTTLKQDCLQTAAPSHAKLITKTKALGESNDYCFIGIGRDWKRILGSGICPKHGAGFGKTQNAR